MAPIDGPDFIELPNSEPWIDYVGDPVLEIDLLDYWEFGIPPDPWEVSRGRGRNLALSYWSLR